MVEKVKIISFDGVLKIFRYEIKILDFLLLVTSYFENFIFVTEG
jgi:hypothetical protein